MTTKNDQPVLITYDWVPDFPRGFVRDLRVRWLFEEMGQPYRVETVPIGPKSAEHLAMQPFGQVPMVSTRGRVWFESGAIVMSLSAGHPTLLPESRRAEITEWVFAALNSVEMSSLPWIITAASQEAPQIFGPAPAPEVIERIAQRMSSKLARLETVLKGCDWLAGSFTIADLLMADVLRLVADKGGLDGFPALQAYVARATARPAFQKAHADQMAHWRQADAARATAVA